MAATADPAALRVCATMVPMEQTRLEHHTDWSRSAVRTPPAAPDTGPSLDRRRGLPRPQFPDARILVIDDLDIEVRLLSTIFRTAGYNNIRGETDPRRALEAFEDLAPDLVLLDLHMPGMNGVELLHELGQMIPSDSYLPVLVVTADPSPEVKRDALAAGARDFLGKPFDTIEVLLRAGNLIETRSLHHDLERRVDEKTQEIQETRDIALMTVAKLVDSRDPETGRHLERIAEYSRIIARTLQERGTHPEIDDQFIDQLHRSSPLHDIGKVGISDAILHKPGALTPDERHAMQQHTLIGGGTLSQVIASHPGHTFLSMAANIAYQHHERWDGSGYPHGLAGDRIALAARIVALADAYDAITTARPYETARSHQEATERILRDRGTHFDPSVADAFAAAGDEIARARHALEESDGRAVAEPRRA